MPNTTELCQTLQSLFPQLTQQRALSLLAEYNGSVEAVANVLVNAKSDTVFQEPTEASIIRDTLQVTDEQAKALLYAHGSAEAACEYELGKDDAAQGDFDDGADFADREGISLLCPKCFSSDVVVHDSSRVVCMACCKVFSKDQAKGGLARGPKARKPRKKKVDSPFSNPSPDAFPASPSAAVPGGMVALTLGQRKMTDSPVQGSKCGRSTDSPALGPKGGKSTDSPTQGPKGKSPIQGPKGGKWTDSPTQGPKGKWTDSPTQGPKGGRATDSPGSAMVRLEEARARQAALGPRVRLVVRRAEGKGAVPVLDRSGEQRVLVVPRADDTSAVCTQARAKFNSRAKFRSVLLHSGALLPHTQDVADGTEVYVYTKAVAREEGAGEEHAVDSPISPAEIPSEASPVTPPEVAVGPPVVTTDDEHHGEKARTRPKKPRPPIVAMCSDEDSDEVYIAPPRQSSLPTSFTGEDDSKPQMRRYHSFDHGEKVNTYLAKHKLDGGAQRAINMLSPEAAQELVDSLRGKRAHADGSNISRIITKRARELRQTRRRIDANYWVGDMGDRPPSPKELKTAPEGGCSSRRRGESGSSKSEDDSVEAEEHHCAAAEAVPEKKGGSGRTKRRPRQRHK